MSAAPAFVATALTVVTVLAAITVTPSSVDFGPTLVDGYARTTVTLTNDGAATVTLGEISTSHPAFDAGSRSGGVRPGTTIPPQGALALDVAFRPDALGPFAATLRIPSDDPASPEIFIPLAGMGAVPILGVTPDSIALSLAAGDSATRTITLSNTGDVPLEWSLAFLPPAGRAPGARFSGPRAAARAIADPALQGAGDLNGVVVLWDRSHGQQGTSFWSTLVGDLVQRGATVVENTAPITAEVLAGARILWSQDLAQAWNSSQLDALEAWVEAGGGLLLEGDNPSSISIFNAITNRLNAGFQYAATSGGQGITSTIFAHPTTAGVSTLDVQLHQAKLDAIGGAAVELVRDVAGAPVAVASRAGAGRIVALSDELLQNAVTVPGRGNRTFGNQVVGWLTGTSWVAADPAAGAVPPDSTTLVTLRFTTAETPAGTQRLDATFTTNDPAHVTAVVPVAMTVSGRPDVAWAPAALAFGAVVVGTTHVDTLSIYNAGEEPLTVSAVTTNGGAFSSAPIAPAALAPAESLHVPVTFAPGAVGPDVGTLTIVSDDPDTPSAAVALSGSGQTDCAGACTPPYLRAPTLVASNGFRFGLPIDIAQNPAPIDAFVFDLEFDPALLTFADSASTTPLTAQFFQVSAQEISPGLVRCAGIAVGDSAEVAAGSFGPLLRVHFEVNCPTCIPGDSTNLVLSNLVDDVAVLDACCGRLTFADCRSDGDVNLDGEITEDDALCTLRIVLNGGTVTPECDVAGDCEVIAADVNCDSLVTAADALAIYDRAAAGEPPYPCFAQEGGVATDAAWKAIEAMRRAEEARRAGREGVAARLLSITPSPTAGGAVVEFVLGAQSGETRLRIFDVGGRLVRTLDAGARAAADGAAGVRRVEWDGRDGQGSRVRPGIYFVRLDSGDVADTRKVVVLR